MIAKTLIQFLKGQIPSVGDRWYFGRRPETIVGVTGTLEYRQNAGMYDLDGEVEVADPTIDLSLWAVGPDAPNDIENAYEDLRILLSGFTGCMGQTEIFGCTIEFGSRQQNIPPQNESDLWTFRKIMGIRITHEQERTTWPLSA
jgi:hypothetical protein